MLIQYDKLIPAVYANTTETKYVSVVADELYCVKTLSCYGYTNSPDYPESVNKIMDTFEDASAPSTNPLCYRVANSLIAKEDGVITVVLPKTYSADITQKLERMLDALERGDATTAFQYISMLSHATKNKVAEYNIEREHKTRRSGAIKPCPI